MRARLCVRSALKQENQSQMANNESPNQPSTHQNTHQPQLHSPAFLSPIKKNIYPKLHVDLSTCMRYIFVSSPIHEGHESMRTNPLFPMVGHKCGVKQPGNTVGNANYVQFHMCQALFLVCGVNNHHIGYYVI
jgi:hypothetical protein